MSALVFGATRLYALIGTPIAVAANLKQVVEAPAPSQLSLPGLEAGACLSLPPSHAGSGHTVFIDPGHGGLDPGVVGGSGGRQVLEKDAALTVATQLSTLLRADGYRVVMARTQDSTMLKLSPTCGRRRCARFDSFQRLWRSIGRRNGIVLRLGEDLLR